ncbi:MAG: GTA baseplate fiber-binding domain-containing protein, partial [Caulobacteraceae bacterium]
GLTVRARAAAPAAIGETLSALSPGPLHRLDQANSLTVRMEGGSLESASLAEILAGANACAVLGASGEWEVLQFTTAKLIGASTWRLSGLLRGQAGTDPAMAETPAGAAFVLLDGATARADVALSERGLPLMWKAAPAGAVPAGLSAAETAFTWAGLHFRPFAPAHLAARKRPGGDLEISWVRRARIGGDGWDDEPPLSEEAERYRLEILDGAGVVRTADTATAAFTYTAAMQTADFGGPAPGPLNLRVRQWSATYGWGVAAERMAVW